MPTRRIFLKFSAMLDMTEGHPWNFFQNLLRPPRWRYNIRMSKSVHYFYQNIILLQCVMKNKYLMYGSFLHMNITNISTLGDVIYKKCVVASLPGTVRHKITYASGTCRASIRGGNFSSSFTRALWCSIDFYENCTRDLFCVISR